MNNHIIQLSKRLPILESQLNNHLERRMILLFGNCRAHFDGRIKSLFLDGDRVLIIKKDLSILLHSSFGVKPVQWQLAGAGKVIFRMKSNQRLQMETYRPKTDESFFITFSKVYFAVSYDTSKADDAASIIGHEKDFVEYLVKNPDIIEQDLRIIESEKEIDFGFIDIWAMDILDTFVAIEVKKSSATLADAHQLKRYIDFFKQKGQKVRGILVATSFPKKVKKYLKSFNLEACRIMWQDIFPTIRRPSYTSMSKRLDEFLE
ncbi:MAG: endonuclease NucS domain-containing protein [Promethearchaeota archaeon]